MKENEKIIFEMESGYNLIGLEQFNLENMCLQFTNLGNIYVSKVDSLDEVSYFIMYNYEEHRKKLYSELDENNVNVVSSNMPFEIHDNGRVFNINLNLIIVLDIEEFIQIKDNIDEFIFIFNEGKSLFILDGEDYYVGYIELKDRILNLFNDDNKFEVEYTEISDFNFNRNLMKLGGFFCFKNNKNIVKKIDVIGAFDSDFKRQIASKTNNNKKILNELYYDVLVYTEIDAKIESKRYKSKKVYIFLKGDKYLIFDKESKSSIWEMNKNSLSKIMLNEKKYLIFDGKNFISLNIDSDQADNLKFSLLKNINEKKLAFTLKQNPIFIESKDEELNISSIDGVKLLSIDKNTISDIKIYHSKLLCHLDYFLIEVIYSDKLVKFYVKKAFAETILIQSFEHYHNTILNDASLEDIYENWTKSVADMVIFNYFSDIYLMMSNIIGTDFRVFDDHKKVELLNSIYKRVNNELVELDKTTIYLSEVLRKNEINYFKSIGKDPDLNLINELERTFFDIRNDIGLDLTQMVNIIANSRNFIGVFTANQGLLKTYEDDNEKIIFDEIDTIANKLEHFYYDMLPHYIGRILRQVFISYRDLYKNYSDIDGLELKKELLERLRINYVYKQFSTETKDSIIRKKIIDDLYSLMKFSNMKLESEYYFSGGYRK
ncbi:hypothetical protein [Peptostreptococcus equinus]|uniref:Uncharacterized protein n=1 Tax=Peptostreptococcus equinus TaxID=3003601 RepID=A0ABY7JV33_9FIRM|nr:hypothetical protein [Peptostreptococcus sp. CBA3647]WAW15577.1 hypothetical protein O0R46_03795 [Peptostreptococcus sp. CBA3647]